MIELIQMHEAATGLRLSRKIGQPEVEVGTAVLFHLDPQSGRCSSTIPEIAKALGMKEQSVMGALRSLQGKGLLRVTIEPDIEAMARLGDEYRAVTARLDDERQA